MNYARIETEIVERARGLCGKELAGVLGFGSYINGPFKEGESDIDTIVLLHRIGNLSPVKIQRTLFEQLREHRVSVQGVASLRQTSARIFNEGSFTTWITLFDGSRLFYASEPLERFRISIKDSPPASKRVANYLMDKDRFELDGYLKDLSGWGATRGLFSHIRRKLQIMSFYTGQQIAYNYRTCLANLPRLHDNRKELLRLADHYETRTSLSDGEIKSSRVLAKRLTPLTLDVLGSSHLSSQ